MLKTLYRFRKFNKTLRRYWWFWDNLTWTCWGSFCQLWQEYMWSAINVLKKCPNIADLTKRHDKQLNLFDINGTLVKRWCRWDFSSVLDPSTGWFPKRVLKQEFKGNQVTTFFAVNNFANIEAMRVTFFSKSSKFYVAFEKLKKLR